MDNGVLGVSLARAQKLAEMAAFKNIPDHATILLRKMEENCVQDLTLSLRVVI